jgi:voltage-dependent calcium channel L type alpha-1D
MSCVFAFEAICRIIAHGFFWSSDPTRKSYISSGSNKIDFFVCVGCDLSSYLLDPSQKSTFSSLKVIRTVRAFRALRMISKNASLKLAMASLFGALPAIFSGMLICSLVILVYAIIGVNFFKGGFYYCYTGLVDLSEEIVAGIDSRKQCEGLGGVWMN